MASTEQPPPSETLTTTTTTTLTAADTTTVNETPAAAEERWPGWPGDCVFRILVPEAKVGSIIGRKGELIKKLCEDTKARVRVLDGPIGVPDRVVLVSGKEKTDAPLSPAMDAVMKIFKRVNGLPESENDVNPSGPSSVAVCSVKLLVASAQAVNLIGKQGSVIKTIQESSGASIRVLDGSSSYATSDERVVEVQGEAFKVMKGLEGVLGHLRKFLVDRTVLPLFEKNYNTTVPQERQAETWTEKSLLHTNSQPGIGNDYPLSLKREMLRDTVFLDRESLREPILPPSRLSLYERDAGLPIIRSPGPGHPGGSFVTQVSQTMQIPLDYADDIIGVGGRNIAYIRQTSNAILTVQESIGQRDAISVEIKGTSSQVQKAQQLINDIVSNCEEAVPSSYSNVSSGLRSSYPELRSSSYHSSTFGGLYDRYGSSGLGGYSSYRM